MKRNPFLLLCSAGLFAVFSSTISKSPVLPMFASHLGADPSGVGAIASVSALTGIIASIPSGMLSDKFGRKRMLTFSVFVFSTAPFLYFMVTKLWHLGVIRFYHGLATAIFTPVAMAMVSDLFQKERGEKIGWFSTSTLLGRFMAPLLGGGIIGALSFNPGMSYKTVYLASGITGIMALLLIWRMPSIEEEKKLKKGWNETWRACKTVMSNKGILMTSAVEASILFAYGTFETFLPLHAINMGLTAYAVGLFLSAQVLTLALTKPVMGLFSDRHGRKPQIFAGAIIGAVSIVGFSMFTSFISLLLLSILFGLSLSMVTAATSAFIADLSTRETHGSAMGVLGSIMDIGHTTGPLISGVVASHLGFGSAFICASLVLVTAAALFLINLGTGNPKSAIENH